MSRSEQVCLFFMQRLLLENFSKKGFFPTSWAVQGDACQRFSMRAGLLKMTSDQLRYICQAESLHKAGCVMCKQWSKC